MVRFRTDLVELKSFPDITEPDIRNTFFKAAFDTGLLYEVLSYERIPRYDYLAKFTKLHLENVNRIKSELIENLEMGGTNEYKMALNERWLDSTVVLINDTYVVFRQSIEELINNLEKSLWKTKKSLQIFSKDLQLYVTRLWSFLKLYGLVFTAEYKSVNYRHNGDENYQVV